MKPLSTNGLATVYDGANQPRRALIAWCAAACAPSAVLAPLASFAQQPAKIWRIGYLGPGSRPSAAAPDANIDAFMRGMRELGYTEGKNLQVESRFADGDYARLPALAEELTKTRVDVLVTYGTAATRALSTVTQSIPIVIAAAIDPVAMGFAASFARPGKNMTGLSAMVIDLSQKHLDLLRAFIPKLSRVALLVNPGNRGHAGLLKGVQEAAQGMKITVLPVEAGNRDAIEAAFARAKREKAGAMIIAGDAWIASQSAAVAAAAAKHRMPTISTYRSHTAAGALVSYGQNIAGFHRRAATYVDKIFKGAKAAEMPIEQPSTIDLVINRTTAKALGLVMTQELLLRETEAIE